MELLTTGNETMVRTIDPIPGITNPLGPTPTATSLSVGNAVGAASNSGVTGSPVLALFPANPGIKDLVFLGVVGFFMWKYGRRFF